MGTPFTDAMPDTANLPRRRVTPDEFRLIAVLSRWRHDVVELFLRKPYCAEYVAIGERDRRMMVRVVDNPAANNPTT